VPVRLAAAAKDPESDAAHELDAIEQIGPSVAADIRAFFAEKHNHATLDDLEREIEVEAATRPRVSNSPGVLRGGVCAATSPPNAPRRTTSDRWPRNASLDFISVSSELGPVRGARAGAGARQGR